MAPEKRFWQWLSFHAPKSWHCQRIETTTGRGVPDVNIASPEGEFWIELKRR